MNISDIVSLTKAGFTKDDIMQILNTDQPQQVVEQPQQVAEQPQQVVEQPQQPAEALQPQPQPQSSAAVDTRLDYIINRLNLMAVNNSNTSVPQTESTDDILASIINPTYNKKGE